ncbi:MAG TPA: thrombospondin type 3 repeat-containing protein, partial [Salegentibacter sp.]|nr:thrombospondin type 3 repeat-containing protein [Salegentibacter sp.]
MKNFNKYMGAIAIIAMLFTSCSEEETDILQDDAQATLSFGTVLNDLVNNSRQQADLDIPACMDDEPAYVHVVLTGEENVGTMEVPLVVNVNPTPIQEDGEDVWFTQESASLELIPGDYVLTYFAVYNADDEMIWLAPTSGGDLADFVGNPLPLDISLGAGVKKYVDVEVLCFDDRMVNEYGYLFFDIIGKEVFEYCFFANYCDDDGRHYPARFSVDIWLEGETEMLYSGMINEVDLTGEDPSASPICFALPNLSSYDDDEDYIHYSLTLLDFEGVYDAPEMMDPIEGTLSRNDIWANLNDDGETVEYFHARFNCGSDDNGGGNGNQDSDGDGIPDNLDNCPNLANPDQEPDADCDGILDAVDNCPNLANPGQEPDADCDG